VRLREKGPVSERMMGRGKNNGNNEQQDREKNGDA
jgi:hypothetical protein